MSSTRYTFRRVIATTIAGCKREEDRADALSKAFENAMRILIPHGSPSDAERKMWRDEVDLALGRRTPKERATKAKPTPEDQEPLFGGDE